MFFHTLSALLLYLIWCGACWIIVFNL